MSYEPSNCEHIKTNGVRCGSPALRDEKFCYFHHRTRRDFPHRAELASANAGVVAGHIRNTGGVGNTGGIGNTGGAAPFPAGEGAPRTALDIPFPEDADAIQYGLGKVIYGLLNGTIDRKSAGLVLYALQTASANLKNTSLLKRSQKADEEDRSNVSPLLAYYLGPSREDYGRVLRILQEAEADLKNKTREIAELKERLGEPSEEDATTDAAQKQSGWVERMHEATATEPREERYPRNEDIHSAYAARRSAGWRVPIAERRWAEPGGSLTQTSTAHPPSDAHVHDSPAASTDSSERSAQALVIHAQEDQPLTQQLCARARHYLAGKRRLHLRCNSPANSPTQANTGLEWATRRSSWFNCEPCAIS